MTPLDAWAAYEAARERAETAWAARVEPPAGWGRHALHEAWCLDELARQDAKGALREVILDYAPRWSGPFDAMRQKGSVYYTFEQGITFGELVVDGRAVARAVEPLTRPRYILVFPRAT